MDDEIRQLMLVKKGHKYLVRYAPGEESQVVGILAEMAEDPNCPLDWFDAAMLSHQINRQMAGLLNNLFKQVRDTQSTQGDHTAADAA